MNTHRTLFAATALLLAACGGSPATPEAKAPPTAPPAPTQPAAPPRPTATAMPGPATENKAPAGPTSAPSPTSAPAATAAPAANSGDVNVKTVKFMKDDGGKPGKETNAFTVADRVWHIEVGLDKLVINTKFKLNLFAVRTSRGKDRELGSLEGIALAGNNLTFKIPIDGEMAIGQYRGDVIVGDKKIKEFDFTVEPAKGNGDISVKAWRIYSDDGKGASGAEVKAFATTDRFHHFEVDTAGANIKPAMVKWLFTALDGGKVVPITEFESELILEDSTLTSKLSFKNEIPPGQYFVELMLNGKSGGKFEYVVRK